MNVTCLDLRLATHLSQFKTNLTKNVIKPRITQLGITDFILRVGYGKIVNKCIENFTECTNDDQWKIALQRIKEIENELVVIVNEAFVVRMKEVNALRDFENNTIPACSPEKKARCEVENEQLDLYADTIEEYDVTVDTPIDHRMDLFEEEISVPVFEDTVDDLYDCLLYTSPSPRDRTRPRMPSSA